MTYCLNLTCYYHTYNIMQLFSFTADIDECATDKHNCSDRMNCSNTIGGYECKFNEGYNSSIELEGECQLR